MANTPHSYSSLGLSYPPTESELAAFADRWMRTNKADEGDEVREDFVKEYSETFAGSIPPHPADFWRTYALS